MLAASCFLIGGNDDCGFCAIVWCCRAAKSRLAKQQPSAHCGLTRTPNKEK